MSTILNAFTIGCALLVTAVIYLFALELWWKAFRHTRGLPKLIKEVDRRIALHNKEQADDNP